MRGYSIVVAVWFASVACGGSGAEGNGATPAPSSSTSSRAGDSAADGATTETLPLSPGDRADAPAATAEDTGAEASPFVTFVDPATGFSTDEVHDADREIVHFDASVDAMVSAASGDRIGGWTVAGADLDWTGSRVSFRVRFGTEAGERRAYFTEAGPGTICNLTVAGPDVLFISGTSETPPNP